MFALVASFAFASACLRLLACVLPCLLAVVVFAEELQVVEAVGAAV